MIDVIHLSGIEVFGHHGVFAHERENGQLFVVDLDVEFDATPAGLTDDVVDTIDYGTLAAAIHDAVAHEPVNLLETLCFRLLRTVFVHEQALAARVTIHKPEAPMQVTVAGASVTLYRTRDEMP